MKTLSSIFFLLIFGLTNSFGQNLDKDYLDNWILKTFPNSKIDNNVIYILNGFPIGDDNLNSELAKYKPNDLTTINYIDKATIDSLTFCKPLTGIVIMISKGKQTQKSVKSDLKLAQEKYIKLKIKTTSDINPLKGEPVLIIDGEQIFYRDCYERINRLNYRELIGVNIIDKPVSKDLYGANAVNGLIIITRK